MTKIQFQGCVNKAKAEIKGHELAISAIKKKFKTGPLTEYNQTRKAEYQKKCKEYNAKRIKSPGKTWITKHVHVAAGKSYGLTLPQTNYVYVSNLHWGHDGKKAKSFPNVKYVDNNNKPVSELDQAKAYAKAAFSVRIKDEKCLLKEEIAKLRKDIVKLGKKK